MFLVAGDSRHDRSGQELWSVTDRGEQRHPPDLQCRWKLLWRGQLAPRTVWTTATRWWEDRSLLLMTETPDTLGLGDGYGRRVVDLWAFDDMPPRMPFARFRLAGQAHDHMAAFADDRPLLFRAGLRH